MADFTSNRYMTSGVQAEIEPVLQVIMWSLIDEDIAKGFQMDYLQVFILKSVTRSGRACQEIMHSQEQPEQDKKTIVDIGSEPLSAKIFAIDSVEYVTALRGGCRFLSICSSIHFFY